MLQVCVKIIIQKSLIVMSFTRYQQIFSQEIYTPNTCAIMMVEFQVFNPQNQVFEMNVVALYPNGVWIDGVFVVNKTPHQIGLCRGGHEDMILVEPEGEPVRLKDGLDISDGGFNVKWSFKREVINLPDPHNGVVFIVSMPVLRILRDERFDLRVPVSNETARRNDEGYITCVCYLAREINYPPSAR